MINAGSRKEIAGASVTVSEKNAAALLSYAISDAAGAYRLVFKSTADCVVVSASGINLKKQLIVIANKTQVLNFNMPTQAVQLKEIKIAPPKIRQIDDTLNYNVESFTDKNDRTIGEVLRKMPGFTVEENGTIIYNNKPINKFYIENSDLLQGRYNIATNNIEAKDVSTVQVLENHQPVKALKGREFTDEAAINLKLKNSAKGVLVANAQVGAGLSPLLWDSELFTMYFNKRRQNMNTYKGNNTGSSNSVDFISLYAATPDSKPDSRLSVQSPAPPAVSRKRYLFNRENVASTNNLWTLGKDLQLTSNFNFVNDVREKNSASISSYYLPSDQVLTIDETLASSEHISVLNGSLQLNANREKFYLDNTLKFNRRWNREQGSIFNPGAVLQNLADPFFEMNNNLSLIKKYKNTNLKVNSTTAYRNAPQTLTVHPLLYPDLFDNPDDFSATRQTAEQTTFSSVNKFSLSFGNRVFKQTYTAGFDMDLQRFHSTLQAQDHAHNFVMGADSLSNDLRWNTYKVYFNPEYTYVKKRFRTTLNLPLTYRYLQARDHGQEVNVSNADNQNSATLCLDPGLNVRYDLSLFWNVSASARYNSGFGDIENGFTGYIMQTYRNLVRNDGRLPQQRMQTTTSASAIAIPSTPYF